jgi:hypothetical protein
LIIAWLPIFRCFHFAQARCLTFTCRTNGNLSAPHKQIPGIPSLPLPALSLSPFREHESKDLLYRSAVQGAVTTTCFIHHSYVMSIRVLIKDYPSRCIALATPTHALLLKHSSTSNDRNVIPSRNASQTSLGSNSSGAPRSIAEFAPLDTLDLSEYRSLGLPHVFGTLGLITVNNEVFLCVVNSATKAAEVRPGETVQKINSVEFRMAPHIRCKRDC